MIDEDSFVVDLPSPVVDLAYSGRSIPLKNQMMRIKQQLQLYLDRKDISAAQLSKQSGVSKQVLSLWLSGGKPRNVEQVKKVAEALGTTVDHLCFGEGIESTSHRLSEVLDEEWISGVFEVKVRRIKK